MTHGSTDHNDPDPGFTKPMPSAAELGAYFGGVLPDHKAGRSYEVVTIDPDDTRVTYGFCPAGDPGDECVALQFVNLSGGNKKAA